MASPESGRALPTYLCLHWFDAVSTTAQEAKNPQRDLPIGMIASLAICTVLYIAVAGVLTGIGALQQINIEAPGRRCILGPRAHYRVQSLPWRAGWTDKRDAGDVIGQTRVLYAMANDGLLPKNFFAAVHPGFGPMEKHDPRRFARGDRGQSHSHR